MKLLLTNDDGIHAPGLRSLQQACAGWGSAVVVAPDQPLSGCSHRTTTDRPLLAANVGDKRYSVDGAPADCVRIGLVGLAADPEWVLSGINDGGNLGVDIYMSGTVAAAREATLMGYRSIAISHYRTGQRPIDWERAAQLTAQVLNDLTQRPNQERGYWNVNLPDDPSIERPRFVDCQPDHHALPVNYEHQDGRYRYRGNYHNRPRTPSSDVDVCFSGHIAISFVKLSVT